MSTYSFLKIYKIVTFAKAVLTDLLRLGVLRHHGESRHFNRYWG